MKRLFIFLFILFTSLYSQNIDSIFPELYNLCKDLHQHPELSLKEENTSIRIATELKKVGFEVTERFAGYGLVGILNNGDGKTLLIRTDLDALPIEENTSLPFTSKNKGVMHACGHDIHMSVFIGVAKLLTANKNLWNGKVIMVGQPAEELGSGARMMLRAGLYEIFGIPDYALAIHVTPAGETGTVLFHEGFAMSNATSVTIKVKGVGGHGASPHLTIDPIVLASQMVLSFQTIVSRELSPFDPAVVTVGYFKGGTKHNIIPNEVELGLTVRAFSDEVREKIISSIKMKTKAIAESAGLKENLLPEVIIPEETPAIYNNPELTKKIVTHLQKELGKEKIIESPQWSASEDFAEYGRTKEMVPSLLLWIGTASKEDWKKKQSGVAIPFVHSPNFNPDYENTIKTGVKAIINAAFILLKKDL